MTSFQGQISKITNMECCICLTDLNQIKSPILPVRLEETARKCTHVYCEICFQQCIDTYNKNQVQYQTLRRQVGIDAGLVRPLLNCSLCTGKDPVTGEACDGAQVSPQYIKLSNKDMAKLGVEMICQPQEKSIRSTLYKVAAISVAIIVIIGAIILAVILV